MYRFKIYCTIFGINSIILILSYIFSFAGLAGIIIFLSFLFSVIYFIFTFGEVPKPKNLKIPEVHNYYKSRMNNYGNFVGLEFSLIALLFFIEVYNFNLELGIATITVWFVSIPATYFIILKTASGVEKEKLINYIQLQFPDLDINSIERFVVVVMKTHSSDKTYVLNKLKSIFVSSSLPLEAMLGTLIKYIQLEDVELNNDEIKEVNKY